MSRRWFYKLFTILPLVAAFSLGLSLWQSGGALLYPSQWIGPAGLSFSNLFSISAANAAGVCVPGDPALPGVSGDDGNGRIYYNSGCKRFRIYQAGSWQDLGGYWSMTTSSHLYNNTQAQLIVSTTGAPPVTAASPSTGTAGRDALILNVATGSPWATIRLANLGVLGVWSDTLTNPNDSTTGWWADLLAGNVYAKTVYTNCTDPSTHTGCTTVGGGTSLWAYAITNDTSSSIKNTNQASGGNPSSLLYCQTGAIIVTSQTSATYEIKLNGNSTTDTLQILVGGIAHAYSVNSTAPNGGSNVVALNSSQTYVTFTNQGCSGYVNQTDTNLLNSGGDVEITQNLFVDRALFVRDMNNSNSGIWTKYSSFNGATSPNQANCTGSQCTLSGAFVSQPGAAAVVVGQGGSLLLHQVGGNSWNVLATYDSSKIGSWNSVALTDNSEVWAVDPNAGSSVSLLKHSLLTGGWSTGYTSNVGSTPPGSLVFSFPGTSFGGSIYYTSVNSSGTWQLKQAGVATTNNPFGTGINTIDGVSTTINGDLYAISSIGIDNSTLFPGFGHRVMASDGGWGSGGNKTATFYGGGTAYQDLNVALYPVTVAADYRFSCGVPDHCVVIAGKIDSRAASGVPKRNVVIGDGAAGTSTDSVKNHWVVVTIYDSDGVTRLDTDPTVTWKYSWVGNNGKYFMLSGVKGTTPVVVISNDGGNTWTATKPLEGGADACLTSPCNPYVAFGEPNSSGNDYNFIVGNEPGRIYYKGVPAHAGTLEVEGQFRAVNSPWPLGYSKCVTNDAGPNGIGGTSTVGYCTTYNTGGARCPNGYYMVGLISTTTIECAPL